VLVLLPKPQQQIVETYESTTNMKESQVNVVPPLITDSKQSVAVQPGEGALNHPPVSAQPLAALHSFTRYETLDPSLAKRRAAPSVVIRFVGVPLVRTKARTSPLT